MAQLVACAFPSIATSDSSHLRIKASVQGESEMEDLGEVDRLRNMASKRRMP
jgi:hypothetical protein